MSELGTLYKPMELILLVRMVSFEFFLANTECKQMLEIHS